MENKVAPVQRFRMELEKMKPEVEKLLGRRADRFVRVILSYANSNPKLLEVDPKSFYAAMMEVAALDLEVGTLGQADILPYKGQAKLIIGYQGYITLIYRSGMVKSIFSNVVRKKDKFEISFGSGGKLKHKPALDTEDETNPVIGAYAFAELITGGEYYDYMPLIELERIRRYSQLPEGQAWTKERVWMYRKTMIRQLIKLLPKFKNEAEILRAIKLDEAGERDAVKVTEEGSFEIDYNLPEQEQAKEIVEQAKAKAEEKFKMRKKKEQVDEATDDPILTKIKQAKTEQELKEIFSGLSELEKPVYLDKISERNSQIKEQR